MAMWLMMQKNNPEDFVISTGKQYSVRDFINSGKIFRYGNKNGREKS